MTRILVLRPQPGAAATVERAQALGLESVAIPLFEVEAVEWEAPDPAGFDGLLLTSANAVRFGGEALNALLGLKVYSIGQATAEAARNAGFAVAATGDAGVERLLKSIEPGLKLLHLCGEDRREAGGATQQISRVTVYCATPVEAPNLDPAENTIALIHSPRAGRRFAELVRERGTIAIAAISQEAADAVDRGWRAVEVAPLPTDEALLALAARLCNKPDPE